jgi:hypothetical protein
MKLFPIQKIHPILLNPNQFQDRFGQPNAYLDMNPSLHIDASGSATVLVRRVNYRKFPDRRFTIYENQANSEYAILRGQITDPFCTFTQEQLVLDTPLNRYPTYWKGLEDIRFVNGHSVLATIPECNPGGQPSLFLGTLTGSRLVDLVPCMPNKVEKNWMPFAADLVVYSVSPLRIKPLVGAAFSECSLSARAADHLKNYHGSTNGIRWRNGWLFLIHTTQGSIVCHRWFWLGRESIAWSEEFVFFGRSYIEFPCSLCEYNGSLFVSLGVNDDKAFILELSADSVTLGTSEPLSDSGGAE